MSFSATITRLSKSAAVAVALLIPASANAVVWYDGSNAVSYNVNGKTDPVVEIALKMFQNDMRMVTGKQAKADKGAKIQIYQADKAGQSKLKALGVPAEKLNGVLDAFYIGINNGNIVVAGSNGRGTAYGILELSRMAGVSPWVWWGDNKPEKKNRLEIADNFTTYQAPSVEYRGIFLNDEDWSERPWSQYTFEPSKNFGEIGPKTYKALFQLLLRLRANAIWPGMHTGTVAFFKVKGNKEMADSCGIVIGTSHCEPLLRNNVDEWDVNTRGRYNYITNKDAVLKYWTERLQETKGGEYLYTIGMRGIHDGSMEGVKTMKEKTVALQQVIDDQRVLLSKYVNKNVEKVPQVFVPYKEVLQIMENGLNVPDDVTLMWCDDNYGYMTRLSDAEQQKRAGGGGVYYHLSYWGRPHDYLWLTTTQPGLIYNEMKEAYDHNAKKMWIVNVHEVKVAAYDMELFLDMAWNIDAIKPSNLQQHLANWLCREFGDNAGKQLLPLMTEWFRLTAIRKPEFMGWTQVELDKKLYPRGRSQVIDTEFTNEFGGEIDRYLADYSALRKGVADVKKIIPAEKKDAYFAAVEYPLLASAAMAEKMIYAQKARGLYMGQTDKSMEGREAKMKSFAAKSLAAYNEIQELTNYYNNSLAGGKWKHIMDCAPRDLYVFYPPTVPTLPTEAEVKQEKNNMTVASKPIDTDGAVARNACDYDAINGKADKVQMLGHSMNALALKKGSSVEYKFDAPKDGDAKLYLALIPTQPNDKGDIRVKVTVDGNDPVEFSLKEPFRSENWKKSVLRGQALKTTTDKTHQKEVHTLKNRGPRHPRDSRPVDGGL